MRPLLAAASLIAFTLACRQSHLGACGSDSDCAPGARCDTSQETPVCIVPPGGCVPICTSGQICNGAAAACEPASSLRVAITSPSAGAFGDGTLHATATASAPGGVESLRFELRSHTNSAVLVPGAPTAPGASTFAADIPIGGALVDGAAELRALVTWNGGSGASDPVAVIVDQHPPVISEIAITPAGLTTGAGHTVYASTGAPLTVRARVTDASGIADGTVCLAADGEEGTCPHPGAAQGGGTYQFTVPRRDGDGSTAVRFTIRASDIAAATLGSAHATRAQSPALFFDRRTPAIVVQPDTAWYSRSAARAIPVVATIIDPYGVAGTPQLVSNGVAHDGVQGDGATWSFALDAQDAPAGAQDAYAFQLRAANALGTAGSVTVTRNVDDVQPAVTFQVYRDAPGGAGAVTYPAAVQNTGWDGTQFVYSDVVHVAGSIRDPSGVSAASVVHVDGRAADGSASWGAVHALGCDGTQTTCTFDLQVPLNEPGKEFHTGAAVKQMGSHLAVPVGTLSVVVTGADTAVDSNGSAAPNARTQTAPVQVTRLLWQLQMPYADAVTGLAVHPNGNLIVTTDGTLESVYALRPDAPEIRWQCWEPGPIDGEPAIGQGDATAASIYLAARSGTVFALSPDGTKLWQRATGETLAVGPAISSVGGFEQVIVPGGDAAKHNLYGVTQGALGTASMSAADRSSSPLILGKAVFYGTSSTFERRGLTNTGTFGSGAPAQPQDPPIVAFFEVMTDGTNLFTWRDTSTGVTSRGIASYRQNLDFRWRAAVTPSAGFTTSGDGTLVVPLAGGEVDTAQTAGDANNDGILAPFVGSLGNSGHAGLVGSGGHVYFARDVAQTVAYTSDGTLSFLADPDGATFRATTMDCQGRLFAAANAVDGTHALVYALVTDDGGLADAPWPSYRRDSRNSGNAGFPRYGARTGATCTQ